MNDLLEFAINAHGGLKRKKQLTQVSAHLEVGGVRYGLKGQQGCLRPMRVTVDFIGGKRTRALPTISC